ncbi:MAG TPA: von Willebrand factor type A domain-containing protein, partial [Verrucomicrobiae bacterium]
MNPEPTSNPRAELEARLTALLLGELTDDEAAALRRELAADPALAKLHDELRQTIALVRETVAAPAGPAAAQPQPLRLSDERREKLLSHFKTLPMKPVALPRRTPRDLKWLMPMAAAAAVALLASVIALPNFTRARQTAQRNTVINNLRQIEGAKEQWALEHHKSANDLVTPGDLRPYFRGNALPSPLAGETYVVGRVGEPAIAEFDASQVRNQYHSLSGAQPSGGSRGERAQMSADGKWAFVERNSAVGPRKAPEALERNNRASDSKRTELAQIILPALSESVQPTTPAQHPHLLAIELPAPNQPMAEAGEKLVARTYNVDPDPSRRDMTSLGATEFGVSPSSGGAGGAGGYGNYWLMASNPPEGRPENVQQLFAGQRGANAVAFDWFNRDGAKAEGHDQPTKESAPPAAQPTSVFQERLGQIVQRAAGASGSPAGPNTVFGGGANLEIAVTREMSGNSPAREVGFGLDLNGLVIGSGSGPSLNKSGTGSLLVTDSVAGKTFSGTALGDDGRIQIAGATSTPRPVADGSTALSAGGGVVSVNGANAYAGGVVINGGTLALTNGSGSLANANSMQPISDPVGFYKVNIPPVASTASVPLPSLSRPEPWMEGASRADRGVTVDPATGAAIPAPPAERVEALEERRSAADVALMTAKPSFPFPAATKSEPALSLGATLEPETLGRMEKQRQQIKDAVTEFERQLGEVRGLDREARRRVLPKIAPDSRLNELNDQLQAAETKLGRLVTVDPTPRPELAAAQKQVEDLKLATDERVAGIAEGLEIRKKSIEASLAALDKATKETREANLAMAPKTSAYQMNRQELEKLEQVRDALNLKFTQEQIDTQLPRSSSVVIANRAEAESDEKPGLWRRLNGAFSGEVERTARIAVEKDTPDVSGIGAARSTTAYDSYHIQTQLDRIQSKPVLAETINRLRLDEEWAKRSGGHEKLKDSDASDLLRKKLSVQVEPKTGLIDIKVKSDKPEEAARIANTIAEVYRETREKERQELAAAGTRKLARQLQEQEQKIANAKEELVRLGDELTVASTDAAPPKRPVPAPIPQPEILTRENSFSTFSLNVSDVSFKLAAASLEKGQMPEPASVRSEEFINAFDYRDPEAAAGVPVAFAWERAQYPFAHNRDLLRFSL